MKRSLDGRKSSPSGGDNLDVRHSGALSRLMMGGQAVIEQSVEQE